MPALPDSTLPPLRVFLVEDSATIRQNLVATLEEWAPVQVAGFAETADDAQRQLLAAGADCDLVILDLRLRQGSGLDVLKALKRAASRAACVVLSNYATPSIRELCVAAGADRVFDKSGEVEALLDYCGALAASRSAA